MIVFVIADLLRGPENLGAVCIIQSALQALFRFSLWSPPDLTELPNLDMRPIHAGKSLLVSAQVT
jgi:hypothetical protein